MIAILTSGVALGVHVPGLLLASRLRERGVPAAVEVLERLLPAERLAAVTASREVFHRDFRVARAGQRIASDPLSAVDAGAREELFRRWEASGVRTVVVFSGFWLNLVRLFTERTGLKPRVILCHVDSVASPSFRNAGLPLPGTEEVWLASRADTALPWTIPVTAEPPLDWGRREPRLLVHGGGWGMGTYRDRAAELASAGHDIDLVVHAAEEADPRGGRARHFALSPTWHPWLDNGYPPLGRLLPGRSMSDITYTRGSAHHSSFDLARTAHAMVSKPGGGTLLDSLWSATPLVLLEPSGEHESHNAQLWCDLGFGVRYEDWRADGFSLHPLEKMHHALLGAAEGPRDLAAALSGSEVSLCSE
ncbi:hypothetical protein AB0L80_08825 [Streptomyces sp. NPDC052069]|uniref:hypothetical protein n=1 Tax=Streptomyces sp. NPDC052069 TaxID=3154650 RepID=UPI0034153F50